MQNVNSLRSEEFSLPHENTSTEIIHAKAGEPYCRHTAPEIRKESQLSHAALRKSFVSVAGVVVYRTPRP